MFKATNKNIGLASLMAFENFTVNVEQFLRSYNPQAIRKINIGKRFFTRMFASSQNKINLAQTMKL